MLPSAAHPTLSAHAVASAGDVRRIRGCRALAGNSALRLLSLGSSEADVNRFIYLSSYLLKITYVITSSPFSASYGLCL